MTALGTWRGYAIRPTFLFGLGAHLAAIGLLLLAIYYLVGQISPHHAPELLGWVVPVGQGSCFLAAVALAFGLGLRGESFQISGKSASGGWMISKVYPYAAEHRPASPIVQVVVKAPNPDEVADVLKLLKAIDWKVFRDLSVAYFRELGFSVLSGPSRSSGIDFLLYTKDDYTAVAVRCLPWGTETVDAAQVKQFHRASLLAGAVQGVLMTTGAFTDEAVAFAMEQGLELVGGECCAYRLLSLPAERAQKLIQDAAGAERIRDEGKRPAKSGRR